MKTCFNSSPFGLLLEAWSPYVDRYCCVSKKRICEDSCMEILCLQNSENKSDKEGEMYANFDQPHLYLIIGFVLLV